MLFLQFRLFYIIFGVYLFGMTFYQVLPMTVPLLFEVQQHTLLRIVGTALLGFGLTNLGMGPSLRKGRSYREILYKHINLRMMFLLFVLFFCFAASLFVERGVPALHDQIAATDIKGALALNTYGRTRTADIFLPYLALYILGYGKFSNNRHKWLFWLPVISVLLFKILAAFKGNLLWFLIGIVYVQGLRYGRISWRSPKLWIFIGTALAGMTLMFAVTEGGGDSVFSLIYLLNRALIYSWEGFNFIVIYNVPPDLLEQLRTFVSVSSNVLPPDRLLAELFFSTDDPRIGVVPTLFGFLYRNGGFLAIILGFMTLGLMVKCLEVRMKYFTGTLNQYIGNYFMYIMLLRIFIVGNVFNEIRGYGLSVMVTFLMVNIFEYSRLSGSGNIGDGIKISQIQS